MLEKKLLIFGLGYTGTAFCRRLRAEGWSVGAILRDSLDRHDAGDVGAQAIDVTAAEHIGHAVSTCDAMLIVAPPTEEICPGIQLLASPLARSKARLKWLGYVSSTAVYGDQGGAWTGEKSPLNASSSAGMNRASAERAWRDLCNRLNLPLVIFRAAGIYGIGRSALDRIRDGRARRIEKENHVNSRIHVDDLVGLFAASMQSATVKSIYNAADDEPASTTDVVTYAAGLLQVDPPPVESFESAALSPAAARYFTESRRISNSLAKQTLGWRPRYPSYREGLAAILAAERSAPSSP